METQHFISIFIIAIIVNYSLLFKDIEHKLHGFSTWSETEQVKNIRWRNTNKNDSVTNIKKDTSEVFSKNFLTEQGKEKNERRNKNTEIWGDEIHQMPNSEIIP